MAQWPLLVEEHSKLQDVVLLRQLRDQLKEREGDEPLQLRPCLEDLLKRE